MGLRLSRYPCQRECCYPPKLIYSGPDSDVIMYEQLKQIPILLKKKIKLVMWWKQCW